MFNLPTLPPLAYRLWLPASGTYIRGTDRVSHRIIGTVNRATAMALPEPQAIAEARAVIRSTGQTVELRPVEPGQAAGDAGQVERTGEGRRP